MITNQELCQQYPNFNHIINFCDYTVTELLLVFIGTIFWVIVYGIIIRKAIKDKFIEMPVPAAASNLAWEFTWGFLVTTDLGLLFVWGLRVWFFMDLMIFYLILKYGHKQLTTPLIIKHFRFIEVVSALLWVFAFYFFVKEGYDTTMGATSAYIITVIMATLYTLFYLSSTNRKDYSFTAAWCKMLGNLLMSIFVFLHYPDMHFLQLLTIVVFIFNVYYVLLFKTAKSPA